jgi:hypothetical protein
MADVISFKNNWKNGVVTASQLDIVWKKYPQAVRDNLLSLLDKFEIAFKLNNQKDKEAAIMIPSLLPEERPVNFETFWTLNPSKGQCCIGRIYQMAFVPLGFFARLMTRLVHHFPKADYPLCWRNGMIFSDLNQTVLLEFNPNVTLYIFVYLHSIDLSVAYIYKI